MTESTGRIYLKDYSAMEVPRNEHVREQDRTFHE